MDSELEQLAALALRNAFWRDFSALCNKYLKACAGLNIDNQESQMGELTSIYGRDTEIEGDVQLNIWTCGGGLLDGDGHETMIEALKRDMATEIYIAGEKVFERAAGEWYFVGARNGQS